MFLEGLFHHALLGNNIARGEEDLEIIISNRPEDGRIQMKRGLTAEVTAAVTIGLFCSCFP